MTTRTATERRLGRGWAFPVRVDPARQGLTYRAGADKVRESLLLILSTNPGERIMRPTFGCGLRRHLAAPNTLATRAVIQRDVQRAIQDWEPRVNLDGVEVTPGPDPAQITITIHYTHVRDGAAGVLVHPFSLEG